MSFRSKFLMIVLGATLAVIAGRVLAATTAHKAISTVASAVWGS